MSGVKLAEAGFPLGFFGAVLLLCLVAYKMHVLEYFYSVYLYSFHCHLGHYCGITTMLLNPSQCSPITAIELCSCFKNHQCPHDNIPEQQSSNLNPIEMVWDELDCRLKKKQPTSAQHMLELKMKSI